MARGLPALWSFLLGGVIIGAGGYLWVFRRGIPLIGSAPFILLGALIILLGLYIQFVAAPEPPTMQDDEELLDTRTPAPRSAIIKAILGLPVLAAASYLLYFTHYPPLYSGVVAVGGLYLLLTGLHTYWAGTLTVYYITNQRLIKEYRFLSLVRTEITFDKIQTVEEFHSMIETVFGLGNIRVHTGSKSLEIVIHSIYDTAEFAELIRRQL